MKQNKVIKKGTNVKTSNGRKFKVSLKIIFLNLISGVAAIVFLMLVSAASAQTLFNAPYAASLLKGIDTFPLITSQADGVVYMNWEAAALIEVKSEKLVSQGVFGWNGDTIRPYWRIRPSQAGRYRVVITRACPPGRESSASIHFKLIKNEGQGPGRVSSFIQPTESWNSYGSFAMGDIDLSAEEYLVEYLPSNWSSPNYLINLQDIRLIPIGALAERERLAQSLLKRLGVADDPALQALRVQAGKLRAERAAAESVVRRNDFSAFTTYDQFLEFDRQLPGARAAMSKLEVEIRQAEAREKELLLETARKRAVTADLTADETRQLDEFLAAYATVQDGATREYPKLSFVPSDKQESVPATVSATAAGRTHEPLYPTGNLDQLQNQKVNDQLPQVELT
ncbi:MAG: hypothetical protein WCP55_18440, partial [Lentisphaerota bacterium]